jgi:hypothetical protein
MVSGGYTYVQVEPNDNSPMAASLVYKNMAAPYPVTLVRVFEGTPDGVLCQVTGWSSADGGVPVTAYAVQVEDSGQGIAYLVYGGDWGIRLRPAGSGNEWRIDDPEQWGESHLVLADAADAIAAPEA